jgi:lipoprotein-releasing system ATP-binding protein
MGQPNEAEVLHGLSLQVDSGEFVALIGPSGSGKSTLLNIIGLLERMTSGSYTICRASRCRHWTTPADAAPARHAGLRVPVPPPVAGLHRAGKRDHALPDPRRPGQRAGARPGAALLDAVGLSQRDDKRPFELSGGMQQRVAIARALVLDPPLVLADEPTGNLDTASSDEVFVQLRRIHAERGTSFIVVTHDPRLAARCDRMVELVDGAISRDGPVVVGAAE